MNNLPQAPSAPNPPEGRTWKKVYDCGCSASGGIGIPDYCSEHGTPPPTAVRVRAKFKVNSYESQLNNQRDERGEMATEELRTVKMSAVYDGSPENKEFFRWTPSGQISLGVLNKRAWDQLQLGEEYYVDFTPARK